MKSLEKDFPQLWILAHGEKGRFKLGMEQPGIDSQVKIDPPPMIEPGKEVSPFPRRAQLLVAPNGPQVGQELVRACGRTVNANGSARPTFIVLFCVSSGLRHGIKIIS